MTSNNLTPEQKIGEILTHLMDYSFDYGAGKIPMSENPPLLVARTAKQQLLSLLEEEKIASYKDGFIQGAITRQNDILNQLKITNDHRLQALKQPKVLKSN